MTPKEKAKELVEKYYFGIRAINLDQCGRDQSKHCALIGVEEILSLFQIKEYDSRYVYYEAVKKELEKM